MAFSNEGFSIREYTWRMRSVDVVKCWPFDDITTYDERKMKSFLPQITVKKFRWWFYELQFAMSGSNKKVKRKKGLLKRNDSVIEEGEESDDDRVASKKVKAPKRRSIVELIAVAPPPGEIVHDEDEGIITKFESLVSKNANYVKKEKEIKRGNPESRILLKKTFKKDKKQLNMKANGLLECKIAKKRPCKSTMHSPVHPTVSSSCSLFDTIVKGKKSNIVRTSKLFSECLKPDSPPQAIVGKLGKLVSDQSSISHILHNASDKHQCGTTGTRQSNKDDVSGESREESSPVRCSELREVSRVTSSEASIPKDYVQGTREDANSWVTNVTGSISRNTEVGLSFDSINERNLCEAQHSPDKVNIVRDTTNVQGSYFSRDEGALLTKERHLYACGGGPAVSLEYYGQQVDFQLPGSSSFAPNTCHIFDALSENNFPRVNDLHLKEYASVPLQSSWLSLSTLKENSAMHPQFVRESSSRNSRTSFIPRLTPKELMHSICTPLNWKQKELVHGESRMPDDFFGLPLNSQGELIKMNSKCTPMVGQLKTSSSIAGNFTSLGAPTDALSCRAKFSDVISSNGRRPLKGQFQVSLNKDLPLQSSYIAMSSGLDNAESQLIKNTGIGFYPVDSDSHSNYSFESDLEQINIPQSSQKLDYLTLKHLNNLQIQKTRSSHQLQSTMRLMGKDFSVGERNLQQLVDGRVWTDKETIVETLCGSNGIVKSRGLLGTTENSTTTGASSTYLADKQSGPKQSFSSQICETDIVEQYGFGSIGRSISPQHLPFFCQAPSHPFQKHGFVIEESSKCEYPYLSSRSLSSTHDVMGRRMSSNNAQLREKGPHATSALGFPVLHPNPTWSIDTLQSIYPSLQGDTNKRALMNRLPSFPDLVTHNRFRNKWQANSRTSARGPNICKRTNKRSPMLLEDPTSQFHNLSPLQDPGDTVKQAQQDFPSSEVDTHCDNLEDESCSFNDLEKAKASDQVDGNGSIDGGSSELISGETNDPARTGPVKLSAGGKHVLKPSKKAAQTNNSSPTSSTIRFVETMRAQNELQSDEKPARIYRF